MSDSSGSARPAAVPPSLRQLALRDRHQALGARFVPFAGWEMPLQYSGIVAEHQAVRSGVGVFDVSHLGRVWLRGPGAAARLRSVTTFDVSAIAPGNAHYSLYCEPDGGIADDVFVYRLSDERWLIIHNAANAAADFARLDAASTGADVEIEDVSDETVLLAVQGPRAAALLVDVLGDAYAELAPRQCVELPWRGATVLVARTGYTGEEGAECIASGDVAGALWDALTAGGALPAGLGARDTLRLEAALPLHGQDIDETTNPYEAGLGFAVMLEDGADFIGRSALLKLHESRPARRLAHLRATERGVLRHGYAVHSAEDASVESHGAEIHSAKGLDSPPLTRLTSGAFSPTLRTGIGMAYLPTQFLPSGTRLVVDVRGRAVRAEVVRRPFYRRPRDA